MPKYKVCTHYGLEPGATKSAGWLNLSDVHERAYYIEAVPFVTGAPSQWSTWGEYHVEVTRVWRRLRVVTKPDTDYPESMSRNDIFWTVKNIGDRDVNYKVYVAW